MGVRHYEELIAWQLASKLRKRVVEMTSKSDVKADFKFCDQVRSAAASIPANIAEGFGHNTRLEFIRFLRYARGSAFEMREWLRDGRERDHLSQEEFDELWTLLDRATGALTRLLESLVQQPAKARPQAPRPGVKPQP
jgi:four helix bundle protein